MPEPDESRALPITELRTRAVRGASSAINSRSISVSGTGPAFPSSVAGQIQGLLESYQPLSYFLPWEVLDYVELLATYNPDYSQAVDNIRSLANSGHDLFVDASGKRVTQEIKELLEEKARTIQARHGGIDGLIDKLLDQAATYGAMCGEWTLNEEMTDVIDFVDLNPKDIRFFWVKEESRWVPHQKVNALQAQEAADRGQEVRGGTCVRLNENTFHYFAFDSAPGNPYGTPPFIAALANIAVQRDMVHNMAQIVKKLGLLGIIDLTVQSLPQAPGETVSDYESRAGAYLDQYVTVVEDMVKDGGLVHFDDVEAKTYNLTGNAAGATNIFKQNEELIFSGLKSMPSVQGRSYSTTETYAGVAYDIIIRNTYKYQRAAKRMIEAGYWLIVVVRGFNPNSIKLEFHKNKSLHRLEEAKSEAAEIDNALKLWAAGVLDQLGFAQRLGYSEPKVLYELPPESPILGNQGAPTGILDDDEDEEEDEENPVAPPPEDDEEEEDEE